MDSDDEDSVSASSESTKSELYFTKEPIDKVKVILKRVNKRSKPEVEVHNAIGRYKNRQGADTFSCLDDYAQHVVNFIASSRVDPKIRVKAAREMLYKFMDEKKVVLTKAGRDKIRSEVKERAPKFKLEKKLFQTEYWIGGKLD